MLVLPLVKPNYIISYSWDILCKPHILPGETPDDNTYKHQRFMCHHYRNPKLDVRMSHISILLLLPVTHCLRSRHPQTFTGTNQKSHAPLVSASSVSCLAAPSVSSCDEPQGFLCLFFSSFCSCPFQVRNPCQP